MILEHLGHRPQIHPGACVAPTATVCGDVTVAEGARILFGAAVIAEGGSITLGRNCIVLENAVIRSTARHSTTIADHCLIGPGAHVVGCVMEESVFIATGAAVFHAAHLETRSEVRIHGVVHTRTRVPADAVVPIGWVAVGVPAQIFPPGDHDAIWAVQREMDFPGTVYGVERASAGASAMPEITKRLSEIYGTHADDTEV